MALRPLNNAGFLDCTPAPSTGRFIHGEYARIKLVQESTAAHIGHEELLVALPSDMVALQGFSSQVQPLAVSWSVSCLLSLVDYTFSLAIKAVLTPNIFCSYIIEIYDLSNIASQNLNPQCSNPCTEAALKLSWLPPGALLQPLPSPTLFNLRFSVLKARAGTTAGLCDRAVQ